MHLNYVFSRITILECAQLGVYERVKAKFRKGKEPPKSEYRFHVTIRVVRFRDVTELLETSLSAFI